MVAPARPSTNFLLPDLDRLDDAALLAMRVCDLPVRLEGVLAWRVGRLHRELKMRGIVALPRTWLSAEFFTPDGVLGFAIPFYLAHRRLMRLERAQMLEVEGAGEAECRRIFRHEAGHCLDEAYAFHRRDRYRELFGDALQEYPTSYKPRPESRDHVINLAGWYAQGHPVEDFAETFAVWLNPYCDWRSDYKRWPLALCKLEYVDEIMREIAGKPPIKADKREVEPLRTLTPTLHEHYAQKRAYFAWRWPANYDVDLRRIFSGSENADAPLATGFLRRKRAQLRNRIAEGTGVHAYTVDQLLRQMIARSQSLGLRVVDPPEITTERLLVSLSMQIATVVQLGYPKVAL